MFDEFEAVCPNCDAILRLTSDYYESNVEMTNEEVTKSMNLTEYSFQCVRCDSDLRMDIKVSLK